MHIDELYQQTILEHNKNPRNFYVAKNFNHTHEGFNPLCGDRVSIYVRVDKKGVIEDISFQGVGCAISKSSASMMTEALKGKNTSYAEKLFLEFQKLLRKEKVDEKMLGKLMVFSGVWKFSSRVKCANLCWHTMKAAIAKEDKVVKTE